MLGVSPEYFVQMSNVIASSIRFKWLKPTTATTRQNNHPLPPCFTTSVFTFANFRNRFIAFLSAKQLQGQSHCPHWRTFCRLLLASFIRKKPKNKKQLLGRRERWWGRLFPKTLASTTSSSTAASETNCTHKQHSHSRNLYYYYPSLSPWAKSKFVHTMRDRLSLSTNSAKPRIVRQVHQTNQLFPASISAECNVPEQLPSSEQSLTTPKCV